MNSTLAIFRKEFNSFFASSAAWLFIGAYLLATLFIFFWAEAFFARNIADLKPLFKWTPVLLIFLVAAISMRTWSEERRSGTIESLLTSPLGALQISLGKFLANLALVSLAILLTLPLALSVSSIGPLDWGPAIGGYLASLFLAAAYVAIGLYMSGRTDNPMVALLLTVACSGLFYLIGSDMITRLFDHSISDALKSLGSGSRFESIMRGVLDIRDIYYYLSIVGCFLSLNVLHLHRLSWADDANRAAHAKTRLLTLLLISNLLLPNFWLHSVRGIRLDLTENQAYTLSEASQSYLQQATEPLLIRGYFSQKSHPLLEPLIPQIKDLLEEYQVAGPDSLRVEFLDPHSNPDIAAEASEQYGIQPVPFRMASRYEAGVVNSYFDLLITYGNEHVVLSFDDLIEVKSSNTGEPEVLLKNPEYAITSALRKTITTYRSGGNIYNDLPEGVRLQAYISEAKTLPPQLAEFRASLQQVLGQMQAEAAGKLQTSISDPEANEGKLAQELNQRYGFTPQVAGLFDTQAFWCYLVLESDQQSLQIGLPENLDFSVANIRQHLENSLKRIATGYLQTVALATPPAPPAGNPYMPAPPSSSYNQLRNALSENLRVIDADLSQGVVPESAEMLIVLAPENLGPKAVFAIDQFLMQGGTVLMATAGFNANLQSELSASPSKSGLEDWLQHMGFSIPQKLVLDPQNAALPIPVPRRVGSVTLNELVMMPYPHFPDVHKTGLNAEHPVTASLAQLTFNWASPIEIDAEKQGDRQWVKLAQSSRNSWTSDDSNIMPDYQSYPRTGFAPSMLQQPYTLAAATTGRFTSYFQGQSSPLLETPTAAAEDESADESDNTDEQPLSYGSVIERSSDTARLILIASNNFAEDRVLSIASQGMGTEYTAPIEFVQNITDWTLNDAALLGIRSRNQLSKILYPIEKSKLQALEFGNYAAALAGLIIIWLVRSMLKIRAHAAHKKIINQL